MISKILATILANKNLSYELTDTSVLLEGDVYAVFDVKSEINETSISK